MLSWPRDLSSYVHTQATTEIKVGDYDEFFLDEGFEDRQLSRVDVRMLDLTWFFSDRKNFVSFTTMLQGLSSKAYSSELVECVLDKFWEETRTYITRRYMIWHLIYAASALILMKIALD